MDRATYVLILGSEAQASELVRRCQPSMKGHRFVGYMAVNGHARESTSPLPFLGSADKLQDYIFRNPVDLLVALSPLSTAMSSQALVPALEIGLTVGVPEEISTSLDPSISEKALLGSKSLLGMRMKLLSTVPQRKCYRILKRALDIMISGTLLVLMAPVFLLIALAVKLTSPDGPIFYQWRVLGKNGRPFVGYKFRTMVPNADELKQQLLPFNEMQGPVFKMRNDPRITPIGRFLRKFSLDELPQLYSVLKGDMSMVGPRPPSPEEAERFAFWQRRKLSVTPGISCLWQVNGRNEIRSFDQWAKLDLQYIEDASLSLDLKILLRTVLVVFQGHGAY